MSIGEAILASNVMSPAVLVLPKETKTAFYAARILAQSMDLVSRTLVGMELWVQAKNVMRSLIHARNAK